MRLSVFLSLFIYSLLSAQSPQVHSGAVKTDTGYSYYVTNGEPVSISVKLDLELINLRSSLRTDQIFVIPAHAVNYKILDFTRIKKGRYAYQVTASYLWGDQRELQYDELFNYHLPYAKSASWRVSQGYNGSSTHKNTYAIDFTMPIGTAIHASRSGTVIQVKENEAIGCNALKCLEKANFIRILHKDGTIAEYTHLKQNGSIVKKGDFVKQDDRIAYSGNTGWTTGPHLHFTVYQPCFGKKSKTLPVRFQIGTDVISSLLVENRSYRKP
ncbi:M23 family metallopeptidase [Nonlabens sp. MB-3u-79]|uniref:M23 family metallopeptidase n=1 Tax=Nonlabens sp. MB-3u-79 TaxID=2058134 RepID=UPI0012FDA41D|nr:M23 family metallopeptidase [Nonlabens sp. MB-3u-79]